VAARRQEELVLQLLCQGALRALRSSIRRAQIAEVLAGHGLRISPIDLSRYTYGSHMPRPEKALEMLEAIHGSGLSRMVVEQRVSVDEMGVVNVPLLAYDLDVLLLAASAAYLEFRGIADAVLTAAVNGVPLATLVAWALSAKLAVARRERESTTMKYLEAEVFLSDPPSVSHLYLPAGALQRGERVLIVDDLLRSGRTLRALTRIAESAGAYVVGVLALLAVGDGWRYAVPEGARVLVLHTVNTRAR
jgi:adenine/guanine phosphoribosyltransferase-like PRPP-binding protein